jgi:hypothetical protein
MSKRITDCQPFCHALGNEGKEGRREGGKEGRSEGVREGRSEGGKEGRREGEVKYSRQNKLKSSAGILPAFGVSYKHPIPRKLAFSISLVGQVYCPKFISRSPECRVRREASFVSS